MPHPDIPNWLNVHRRLSQGDFAAGNEIVEHFLPWVSQRLCYRRPNLDPDLAAESAENALLNYLAKPQHFDATRRVPLGYWLWMKARGQLSNLWRREQSHQAHEWAVGVEDKDFEKFLSEVGLELTIYLWRDMEGKRRTEEWRQALNSLLPRLGPCERRELELLCCDAPFWEWVEYLRIDSLHAAEQRCKVNAEKDRLKKKVHRLVQRRGSRSF